MKSSRRVALFLLFITLLVYCSGTQHERADRQPAVAGQFYPSQRDSLRSMLQSLFSRAVPSRHTDNIVAVISPHAGYAYSGHVAASSFNQLDPNKNYDNIFVLGPSHHVGFDGASVYTQGDFVTPLGTVKVNVDLARDLLKKSPLFVSRTDAHAYEHSIEVQLPFLQYLVKKSFRIVPIVLGTSNLRTCSEIADVLRPYLTPSNLFIISTDFSHYPSSADATTVDKATADAVVSNSAETLLRTVSRNEEKQIPHLVTTLCGWSCVMTLLSMTQHDPQVVFDPIEYRNSGDVAFGDKNRVVGYFAITVSLKDETTHRRFIINERDKKALLAVARTTLNTYLHTGAIQALDTSTVSPTLRMHCGAFVTLRKHGTLRGCIGRFDASEPLHSVVQQMAVAAAVEDHRFPPVTADELRNLDLEISVLSPMRKISSINEIELGKHGIYVRKGNRGGTLLPQVASETGWTREEFLGHCAQDKAGIGWNGWKDADLFVYEAIVFAEPGVR